MLLVGVASHPCHTPLRSSLSPQVTNPNRQHRRTTTTTITMALEVLASDAQQALFRKWAQGSVFVLDVHDSTKRQFGILAKMMGWVGGEEPWNSHWNECFGEEYIWRAFGK
jgi:hypothetical protein